MILDGELYSFGGIEGDADRDSHAVRATDSTFSYDPGSDSWSSGPAMPHALWGQAGAVAGGTAYLFGGAESDTYATGTFVDTIYSFSPGSGWTTLTATCPERIFATHAATGPDGLIYVVGGATSTASNADTDRIWRFDPATETVETAAWATLPQPIRWPSVTTASVGGTDYLYVFGGHNTSAGRLLPTTMRYSLADGTRHRMADAPAPFRQAISDCVIDGKAYLCGGHIGSTGSANDFKNTVYRYDFKADAWDTNAPQLPRNGGRVPGTAGVIGGNLYIAGGHTKRYNADNAHVVTDRVDVLSPGGSTATATAAEPVASTESVAAASATTTAASDDGTAGTNADDMDAPVAPGLIIEPGADPQLVGASGDDLIESLSQQASGGGGSGAGGGGGAGGDISTGDGSGVLPDTDPSAPPAKRAEQAGLTIHETKHVTSMAQIDGAAHTLYIVDGSQGPLKHAGKHALGTVHDVAICGINGAKLKVPAGFRDYSVTASGGSGLMWSGIDLDQSASGAHAGLNFNIADHGFFEAFKSIGAGRLDHPGGSECSLHIPATSPNGTVRLKNVSMIYGGYMKPHHTGDIGSYCIQFGPHRHKGTLNIVDSQIEEYSNNAIYASACPGTVNAKNCRLYNNSVTQFRVSHGSITGGTVGYDYKNTGMINADAPEHGCIGIGSEQKKAGKGGKLTSVKNVTFDMANVADGGDGIVTYDIHGPCRIGTIEDCDFHMGNVGGAAAIRIRRGGSIDAVKNCTFSGVSRNKAIVGSGINTSGNTFQ